MSRESDDVEAAGAASEAEGAPLPIEFLPWQRAACDKLTAAVAAGRLPHGLVLQGPAGVGKEHFASALAAAVFCTGRGAQLVACGACAECALSKAGTHPDMRWLRFLVDEKTGKEKKSIGVEQVRELTEKLGMTAMRRGHRVAIVTPADGMTAAAQNALLKTLEEPGPQTLIVLITARPSVLLPTLRSRCQWIEIARPDAAQAHEWLSRTLGAPVSPRLLRVAGGAPLKALALAPYFEDLESQMTDLLEAFFDQRVDVTRAAADMQGEGLPARLDWIDAWLGAAIQAATGAPVENPLTFRTGSLLQRAAAELNITAAFHVLDRLREARRLLEGSSSAPLVVESLLLELRAAGPAR